MHAGFLSPLPCGYPFDSQHLVRFRIIAVVAPNVLGGGFDSVAHAVEDYGFSTGDSVALDISAENKVIENVAHHLIGNLVLRASRVLDFDR